jgi:ABC-type sulfate transport system permease subunit
VLVVSSNVAGSTLTLPLLVYQRDENVGGQVTTSVYAAATELAVISVVVLLVMTLFGSRRSKST